MKQKHILAFSLLCTVYTIQASLLDSLWGITTEVVAHEQLLTPNTTLTLENTKGNISIKTWKQNKLVIEAVKKGSKEALANTDITAHYTPEGASIKTVLADSQLSCSVDYTILLPQTTTITLAHTDSGDITIKNTQKPIKAQTHKGSINFENVCNSAHASTKQGNITIQAKSLNANHKILAVADKGNIKLKLPAKTEAKLYAKTERGRVTSDHPITLEQRTMVINTKTIAELKKDVKGFMGNDKGAVIKLHTTHGNVALVRA